MPPAYMQMPMVRLLNSIISLRHQKPIPIPWIHPPSLFYLLRIPILSIWEIKVTGVWYLNQMSVTIQEIRLFQSDQNGVVLLTTQLSNAVDFKDFSVGSYPSFKHSIPLPYPQLPQRLYIFILDRYTLLDPPRDFSCFNN